MPNVESDGKVLKRGCFGHSEGGTSHLFDVGTARDPERRMLPVWKAMGVFCLCRGQVLYGAGRERNPYGINRLRPD